MLLKRFVQWREQRQLRHARIPVALWQRVVDDSLTDFHLDEHELHQLRELASLFLLRKTINGAGGLDVDNYIRVVIAAHACVLILKLDIDYYNGWIEVIVYPDAFVVNREVYDEMGVVHQKRSVLGGEAWSRGPLILSWKDARPGKHMHGPGSNVILHEFAHKLDMLDGSADGTPPLHPDMDLSIWIDSFTDTYMQLRKQIASNQYTEIDPYAAENPAEFFAVVSEAFFVVPDQLHQYHTGIYQQLQLFYRQDPLQRFYNSRTEI
jgi:Mlc titration factor MtfA (ptsG expression regulator)